MSYSFPKGKKCILINQKGETHNFELRKNKSFTIDDIYNADDVIMIAHEYGDAMDFMGPVADKLACQGKAVFLFRGQMTADLYMAAFDVLEGESEFD